MLDLEEIKNFLKVDFNDDDSYIMLISNVAIEYIQDALGTFNVNRAKHKFLALTLIKDMYEKRSYIVGGKDEKTRYIIHSMILQEQLGD